MSFFSWLLGEKEEPPPPEPLVLGAKLHCIYGEHDGFLNIVTDSISINALPQACVEDSKVIDNIMPFGICNSNDICQFKINLAEKWINAEPQNAGSNGKEIITTKSTLICNATGMEITALTSGQDGIFAKQCLLIKEMDEKYPGLRAILQDPYGSLYLNDGMFEMAFQFLEDRLAKNGGSIELVTMYGPDNLEGEYLRATLERLLTDCDVKVFEAFMEDLEQTAIERGMDENEGWNKNYLNAAMMELLGVDCTAIKDAIEKDPLCRWTEEHKMFSGWAAESANAAAFVTVISGGALANAKKDAKVKRPNETEVAKRNFEEAKARKGGSGTRPSWRQSELDAAKDYPDYKAQKSFKNGQEVPYGTKGSVRPDYHKPGNSVDIKNYNVETASGRNSLANNIEKQYNQRLQNLPSGTKQSVQIDIRGQNVSDTDLNALHNDIMSRTNNGMTVRFKVN